MSWILRNAKGLSRGLLVLGAALRVFEYAQVPSLWFDEAHVALRILGRSFWPSLLEGSYRQTMAPGLAALVKVVVSVFGTSELTLRAVPLLASLGALLVFRSLSAQLLSAPRALLAQLVFSLSGPVIFYANEFKPYSVDVFVTLLLVHQGLPLVPPSSSVAAWRRFTVLGALAVWFSFPAAFVLAGLGFAAACERPSRRRTTLLFSAAAAWGTSLLGIYCVYVQPLTRDSGLVKEFAQHQAKFAYRTLLPRTVGLATATGLLLFPLAAWRWWTDRRALLLASCGVAVVVVVLGLAGRYPLLPRLLLFTAPFAALAAADGLGTLFDLLRRYSVWAACLASFAVAAPTIDLWRLGIAKPHEPEEMRSLLQQVRQSKETAETFYVYYGASDAFRYYARYRGLLPETSDIRVGERHRDSEELFVQDLREKLAGATRAWIVFSHVFYYDDGRRGEQHILTEALDEIGTREKILWAPGAAAYLYRFPGGTKR